MNRLRSLSRKPQPVALAFAVALCAFAPAVLLSLGVSALTPLNLIFAIFAISASAAVLILTRRQAEQQAYTPPPPPPHWSEQTLAAIDAWDGVISAEAEESLRQGEAPPTRR